MCDIKRMWYLLRSYNSLFLFRYRLGKSRYVSFKRCLFNYVVFPSYKTLFEYRKAITPKFVPYHNSDGIVIGKIFYKLFIKWLFVNATFHYFSGVVVGDLRETITITLLRGIQFWKIDFSEVTGSVSFRVTAGLDGRGDEKEYSQVSQVALDTTHAQVVIP